jgi:hypothetical protein
MNKLLHSVFLYLRTEGFCVKDNGHYVELVGVKARIIQAGAGEVVWHGMGEVKPIVNLEGLKSILAQHRITNYQKFNLYHHGATCKASNGVLEFTGLNRLSVERKLRDSTEVIKESTKKKKYTLKKLVIALILADASDEQIVKKVKKEFFTAKFDLNRLSWYRARMLNWGLIDPSKANRNSQTFKQWLAVHRQPPIFNPRIYRKMLK